MSTTNWKSQAVEVQISVKIRAPRNGRPLTAKLIEQAIRYRADHGEDAPGFTTRIIRWRHYTRTDRWTSASEADWKSFAAVITFGEMVAPNPPLREA